MKIKKTFTKFIGMRTLKTSISVCLCMFVSKIFKIEYPFYACIAAVISMQGSVSSSFNTGKNRMFGTLVGAFTGLIFSLINAGNIFLIGIGTIIVICICNGLKWSKSASIGCVVFLVIMTNLNGRNPYTYSFNRLIETFIGIIIAIFVNYIVYPPKYLNKIYLASNNLVDKMILFCGNKFCNNTYMDMQTIMDEISSLKTHITDYENDFIIKSKELVEINTVKNVIELCNKILLSINIINSLGDKLYINSVNMERLNSLYNCNISINNHENNDINIVYNYHLSLILDCLKQLLSFNINKTELGNL
ncbi:Uncharacterized membrane protein YgaE, UPF0421/DUF939 family [Clostridium acidisoli DSM 12555]|uniref:Uncharacterized membrane protein YgaE, UPF0421/DUF939 family n=1 Tax=Clostridium acidisoli DSM 12555 TaxID=1121291 RepID=A0A1W1XPL5_9CLOT|nr:aromatic acid exporter family protein [Clostridium acidisoli]SMC25814.1 Uncharacterized membrane protein YgaE, UPF0421/DUF939 family [Clostridium acidisoli DSM 12555]